MKKLILLLLVAFMVACTENSKPETAAAKPADSIFLLDSTWQNQEGHRLHLQDLKGKNLVVAMIFTSCQTACPLLVADMKKVEAAISKEKLIDTRLVLVTIDPENDTAPVLKKYAQEKQIDADPWILLRSDLESTRDFANVLAVKYKKITPIIFSHSNIITVFNKNGEMVKQEEGTVNSTSIADAVNSLP